MEKVRLKNGSEEFLPAVRNLHVIIMALINAGEKDVVYDLVMKCRDPEFEIYPSRMESLEKLSLIGEDGRIHETTRNVVLSMAQGIGSGMSR